MRDSALAISVQMYLFFHGGGIGKYTVQQSEALAKDPNLSIELTTPPDFGYSVPTSVLHSPTLYRISSRFPLLRKLRFLVGQWISPGRGINHAIKNRMDVLHICNINYLTFPCWRRKLNKWSGKLVCTAHDIRRRVAIINRPWEERQLKAFYRRCDAIFVHSAEQGQDLQHFAQISPSQIVVVPHGPTQFESMPEIPNWVLKERLGFSSAEPLALFFGYLRPDKNLDGLLRAMVLPGGEGFNLLVAGNVAARENEHFENCKDLVAQLGLGDRVRFDVRYIQDEEIPLLFAACDWVALPYQESFTSQSGVLNIAAFYERPVLLTPLPSFLDLASKTDFVVLSQGVADNDIAKGISGLHKRLLNGPPFEYESYRKRFSWQRNAEITAQTWREVVAGQPLSHAMVENR